MLCWDCGWAGDFGAERQSAPTGAQEPETKQEAGRPLGDAHCSLLRYSGKIMTDEAGEYYINPRSGNRVNIDRERGQDTLTLRRLNRDGTVGEIVSLPDPVEVP